MATSSVSRFPGLQLHPKGHPAINASNTDHASTSRHVSPLSQSLAPSKGTVESSKKSVGNFPSGGTSSSTSHAKPTFGSGSYYGGASNTNGNMSTGQPIKLERVDTQDLKSKLSSALGSNGPLYWMALMQFMTAKIDRTEFEEEASKYLLPQHVHLHNSLILGLLYNASADVPGPSSRTLANGLHPARDAHGALIDGNNDVVARLLSDSEDADESIAPAKKRLRLLTAGLSRKERARIRNIPKTLTGARAHGASGASSLGWAGAGADMLEKKRKEEEKRKSVQERKLAKEAYTEIGATDWKNLALNATTDINSARDRLSLSVQQELARALTAPLCVQSKQLPDLDAMRDAMTLHAVEGGLLRGTHPQAAALLLAALQCHLQNVMASIISKIRANRQMGIRTTGLQRTAADEYALLTDGSVEQAPATIRVTAPDALDDSFDSSSEAVSPVPRQRQVRGMLPDMSSQTISTSSSSALGNSLADSSMISLVSTDPTSVAPTQPPSEVASGDDIAQDVGSGVGTELGKRARGSGNTTEDDEAANDDGSSSAARSTEQGATTLELRHLAFLLDLAPHTVVEGLGSGAQERLLAADWTNADEDAQRSLEWTGEGALQRQARAAALAKLSTAASQSGAAPSAKSLLPSSSSLATTPQIAARTRYIIDQLAPVRVLDRRSLSETQASLSVRKPAGKSYNGSGNWHATKGGLTVAGASNGNKENKVQDKEKALAAFDKRNLEERSGKHDGNDRAGSSSLWPAHGMAAAAATASANAAAAAANPSMGAGSAARRDRSDPHLYEVIDPVALLATLTA